jgi:hypothetical protein
LATLFGRTLQKRTQSCELRGLRWQGQGYGVARQRYLVVLQQFGIQELTSRRHQEAVAGGLCLLAHGSGLRFFPARRNFFRYT